MVFCALKLFLFECSENFNLKELYMLGNVSFSGLFFSLLILAYDSKSAGLNAVILHITYCFTSRADKSAIALGADCQTATSREAFIL